MPVTGSSEDAHADSNGTGDGEGEGVTPSDETTPSNASHGQTQARHVGGAAADALGDFGQLHAVRSSGVLPVPLAHVGRARDTQSDRSGQGPLSARSAVSHLGAGPASYRSTAEIARPTLQHLIDLRNRLRLVNDAVVKEQRTAFQRAAAGEGVLGWTIVGRNLRFLDIGRVVKGRTLHDVRWSDLGQDSGMKGFAIKVVLLGIAISALCE